MHGETAPAAEETGSLVGFDIGGTTIKWVRLSAVGSLIEEGWVPTPRQGPDSVVDVIAGLFGGLRGVTVSSVGVAVPGHVDIRTGATVLLPNVPGDWAGHPFGQQLRDRLDLPVALVNDGRAFGIAEQELGAARGVDRSAFLVVGTGIGGAIALEGRLLRNGTDSVGEFGHSTVVRNGEPCGCGNLGCAEAYSGVRALTRRYRKSGAFDGPAAANASDILTSLRAAYDARDEIACRIVDLATWATACAVSNLCVALRISTVVIGGGLGIHWPEFAFEITRQLTDRENLLGRSAVFVSGLGDHAGAIGAALGAAPEQSGFQPVPEKECSR